MIFAGLGATVLGWIAQRGIIIGTIAAVAIGVAVWDHRRADRHRDEGAREIVQASRETGMQKNAKVRKIRRRTSGSDAMRRLRDEYQTEGKDR